MTDPIRSFDDLLHHPHPPVELLTLTKQFAKAMVEHPESPLPREVGRLLYFASITVALIRCGQRISDLDNASLKAGLRWCLEHDADGTRSLLLVADNDRLPSSLLALRVAGVAEP